MADPKGLTGWSVTFPHTLKKTTPAAPPPPLLRKGIYPGDYVGIQNGFAIGLLDEESTAVDTVSST